MRSETVKVPPLKIQGIKTRLVPWIMEHVPAFQGKWIEPFTGSGVVGFNAMPEKAIFGDINPHSIRFFSDIQEKRLTSETARKHLETEGEKLAATPAGKESHYYKIRARFNESHDSHDFLFLNRACFNGLMRFGPKGFNTPFCRKPERFSRSLVTKIARQIDWCSEIFRKEWTFVCGDWQNALAMARKEDFVYLDPPYIGRNADYYSAWSERDAESLAEMAERLPCPFILSMWASDGKRNNPYLKLWKGRIVLREHRYFLRAREENRFPVTEALVIGNC